MGLFHHEDDLRPFRQLGGHGGVGVGREAGGGDLQTRVVGEDLFGGGAAQAVAAAEEEDVFQGEFLLAPVPRRYLKLNRTMPKLSFLSRVASRPEVSPKEASIQTLS